MLRVTSREVPRTDREVPRTDREVPRTDRGPTAAAATNAGIRSKPDLKPVLYESVETKPDVLESDFSPSMSDLAKSDSKNVRNNPVRFRQKSDFEGETGLEIGHRFVIGHPETPCPISPSPVLKGPIRQPNITYNSVMEWPEAIEAWISEAASAATRKNFRVQSNKFMMFLDQRVDGKPPVPAQMQVYHLHEYKEFLQDKTTLSQNSIHQAIRTVKSFVTWLFNEKVLDRNIGKKLKAPPYVQPEIDAMDKTDIQQLFDVADDMQRLFLCFGYHLAMRVGALVSLKRKDITDVSLETKTFRLTWLAKGRRQVSKLYTAWHDLPDGWIDDMMNMMQDEYLFPGRKAKSHITDRTARRWMKRLGKDGGVQVDLDGHSKITPHDLRHSGATIIAEASGGNQYQLKEHLHHASVETSKHYVHATKKTVADRENMLRFSNEQNTYQHVAWCNKTCGNACNGEQYAHKSYCNGLCNM